MQYTLHSVIMSIIGVSYSLNIVLKLEGIDIQSKGLENICLLVL